MAKAPEQQSFIDMFARLGRELRLPDMDIEKIIEHHRRNLEALEKSARAASAGAASMMTRQREMVEEALAEVSDMARHYRVPGNPRDLVASQVDLARKSFEAAVKNAGEMADLTRQTGSESLGILRERIHDALEEIREAYEKRK